MTDLKEGSCCFVAEIVSWTNLKSAARLLLGSVEFKEF